MTISGILRLSLTCTGLSLLVGCQSAKEVQVSSDPSVDVSKLTTFYANPLPTDSPMVDEGMKQLFKTIDGYMAEALIDKGYTQTTKDKADFMLVVRGKSIAYTSYESTTFNSYATGSWVGATVYGASGLNEEESTLMVICYDLKNKQLVWMGWEDKMEVDGSNPDYFEEAAKVLYQIISKFPEKT